MKNSRKEWIRRTLFSVWKYVLFFLLISFVVTCCFLLFFSYANIDEQMVRKNAPVTFFNVLLLSLIFTVTDSVYHKYTVERRVKRILRATHQMAQGDFDVRIKPFYSLNNANEFNAIIENLNKMAEELSGVETLRTDFIANVSHELKTPLSVIQNYSTMLQNPNLTTEQRLEYAKTVTEASRRMTNLITNILKLNRLENQQIFPESKIYDLGEQLCECLLVFEDAWEKKNLDIETDIAENITINADEELLSLVWNNLFSNAVKFTESEGKISIGLKEEDGFAVVTVADTGCGINPEIGQHIFEKFYQGDTSHASQGNGLGLALVKRVMDITGGEISVQSTPKKGSTFCVRLKRNTD